MCSAPSTERICVYQAGFLYAHAFLACLLLIYYPTWQGLVAATLLVGGRVLVTEFKLDRRLLQPDLSVSRTLLGLLAPVRATAEPNRTG